MRQSITMKKITATAITQILLLAEHIDLGNITILYSRGRFIIQSIEKPDDIWKVEGGSWTTIDDLLAHLDQHQWEKVIA